MIDTLKVHILPATLSADDKILQKNRLEKLWTFSSRFHQLVEDADSADIILVTDLNGPDWFSSLRNNKIVNRYPSKSFAISDSDFPMPLLHGIYTSGSQRFLHKQRFRTAAYNLYPEEFLNSYIQIHSGNAYDKPKKYLGSFMGRDSAPVRKQIFHIKHENDLYLYNTTHQFAAFGESPQDKNTWRRRYVDILESSKYSICPRGVGPASMRLFESMRIGVAPVILADNWIFPQGPDWNSFALIIKEKDAPRLHQILKSHASEYEERGRLSRDAFKAYFSEENYFNYLIDQIIDIKNKQYIPERYFWMCRNLKVAYWKFRRRHLHR